MQETPALSMSFQTINDAVKFRMLIIKLLFSGDGGN